MTAPESSEKPFDSSSASSAVMLTWLSIWLCAQARRVAAQRLRRNHPVNDSRIRVADSTS
jgi:hypothetical protein